MKSLRLKAIMAVIVVGVLSATIVQAADVPGTTSPWQSETSMTYQRNQSSAAAYNGYLYSIGGSGGEDNKVLYAPISGNGSVGAWTVNSNDIPSSLYRHTAVVNDGYVYVLGGRDGGAVNGVYYAPINLDGSVGAWQTETDTLPISMYYLSSFVYNDYIYIVGGNDNSVARDEVFSAPINGDGSIGAWVESDNTLPAATPSIILMMR